MHGAAANLYTVECEHGLRWRLRRPDGSSVCGGLVREAAERMRDELNEHVVPAVAELRDGDGRIEEMKGGAV